MMFPYTYTQNRATLTQSNGDATEARPNFGHFCRGIAKLRLKCVLMMMVAFTMGRCDVSEITHDTLLTHKYVHFTIVQLYIFFF